MSTRDEVEPVAAFPEWPPNTRLGWQCFRSQPAPMPARTSFLSVIVVIVAGLIVTEGDLSAEIVAGPFTNSINTHIYYLLAPTNGAAADEEAMFLGGHLATVRSAEENAWILDTLNPVSGTNNLFIGLTDRASEGTFVWMSGETNTFRNWKSGEPSNSGGNEDYTELIANTGKWNDIRGQYHYGVAEIPLRQTNSLPVVAIHQTDSVTVELSWVSDSNQLYQVLWAISLATNGWSTLGTYLYGTGTTLYRADPIDQPRKFYQVVPIQ